MILRSILQEVFHEEVISQPKPSNFDFWLCRRRSGDRRRGLLDGCAIVVLAKAENATEQGYELSLGDQKARKFASQLHNAWSNHPIHCLLVTIKGPKLYYVRPGRTENLVAWKRWKKIPFSESLHTRYEASKKPLISLATTMKEPESLEALRKREIRARL